VGGQGWRQGGRHKGWPVLRNNAETDFGIFCYYHEPTKSWSPHNEPHTGSCNSTIEGTTGHGAAVCGLYVRGPPLASLQRSVPQGVGGHAAV
jgi:hypothetical protein